MNISIWETGINARKFYNRYRDKFHLVKFYDNDDKKKGTFLYGVPVEGVEDIGREYIVIASKYWKEIAMQLIEVGLKPFCNFGLSEFFATSIKYITIAELFSMTDIQLENCFGKKKIAVVYGNCQTAMIEKLLQMNKIFADNYILVETPKVYEYNSNGKKTLEQLVSDNIFWKTVDLFIYQTVHRNNRFAETLNTDDIIKKTRKKCTKINILNLYFTGYFPQITSNRNNLCLDIDQSGLFPFGDRYVDLLIEKGLNSEEIINNVCKENFIDKQTIEENVSLNLKELQKREEHTDIVIMDYIIENYREEQLFYSRNHPNEKLLIVYTNRILKYLGYPENQLSEKDMIMQCGSLKGQDLPVYPCVRKVLGLKQYEKKVYPNRYLYDDLLLDIKEYVALYIRSKC